MNKKIFALKLPLKLKNCMEFISKEVDAPLSKLYFPAVENATKDYLGIIMIYNLDVANVKKIPDLDELKHLPTIATYLRKKDISPINEFVILMEQPENRVRLMDYFPNIQMSKEKFTYQNINIARLCRALGEKYLNTNYPMSIMDMDEIKGLFIEQMVKNYFDVMAIGTISQLEREWENGKAKLELFSSHLLNKFDDTFQTKIIVVPIEMEDEENSSNGTSSKIEKKREKVRRKIVRK